LAEETRKALEQHLRDAGWRHEGERWFRESGLGAPRHNLYGAVNLQASWEEKEESR